MREGRHLRSVPALRYVLRICRGWTGLVGAEGFEPSWLAPEVFKTSMYAIPSCPPGPAAGAALRQQKRSLAHPEGRVRPVPGAMLPNGHILYLDELEATVGFEPTDRGFADPRLNLLATSPDNTWSGRRDSNPRPSPWQGDALPLRHFRSYLVPRVRIELTTPQFSVACSTD